jgi:uncharacterized protein (DUF1499 family)
MTRKFIVSLGIATGLIVTALLVAASIWPVINEVETGETPEYPDIQPQYYSAEPRRVFEEAKASIELRTRWKLEAARTDSWTIEATHETYVFGFVDDVTVWVEPVTDFVTRVRVRSASRMGKGDFGQNARNIRDFFEALDARLGAVKFDPDELGDSEATDEKSGAEREGS